MGLIQRFLLCSILLLIVECSNSPLQTIDNKSIAFTSLKGKWIIVNYWAAWCPSCLKEIPTLNHLANHYPNQLMILGVNRDHLEADKQRQTAEHYQITYPLLSTDPAHRWHLPMPVEVLPTTFIISPQGKLAYTLQGPKSLPEFENLLNLKPQNQS